MNLSDCYTQSKYQTLPNAPVTMSLNCTAWLIKYARWSHLQCNDQLVLDFSIQR